MKKRLIVYVLSALLLATPGSLLSQTGFRIMEEESKKQVNILYNDKLLTAYCYYDSSRKPVLFPVNTVDGITLTRSYPFSLVPGERTDHPHHTGIWLNYEWVNGLDFWNNSTAIAPERRSRYGTILHQQVTAKDAYADHASLSVAAVWVRPDGRVLLQEQTTFHFRVSGNDFVIDRKTTLTAADTAVVFKDVKDGLFAIRVARELELPSKEPGNYIDRQGGISKEPLAGQEVTGMYYSSENQRGDSVWGSKARWVVLTGKKDGKDVSVAIIDHPGNTGYPAYWHARGYGLFAVNPLGRKIFSNGKEELNLSLPPGNAVTFRYRVVVHSGNKPADTEMEQLADEFAKSH